MDWFVAIGDFRADLSRRRRSALVFGIEYSKVPVVATDMPSGKSLKERERLICGIRFGRRCSAGLNAERAVAEVQDSIVGMALSGLCERLPVRESLATGEGARAVSAAVDVPEPDQAVSRRLNLEVGSEGTIP